MVVDTTPIKTMWFASQAVMGPDMTPTFKVIYRHIKSRYPADYLEAVHYTAVSRDDPRDGNIDCSRDSTVIMKLKLVEFGRIVERK